jgi:hypothetical protein
MPMGRKRQAKRQLKSERRLNEMYRSNVHTLQYLDTAGSEPACEHRLPPGVLVVGDGRANATGPLLADTQAEGRHPLPLQLSQRNFVRGSCGRLTGCMT